MTDTEEEEWLCPVESNVETLKKGCCIHNRVILHIDIDCFYAQVEMLRNPSLKNKPLGIQQKYIIVTCNYVARERGLTKLMSVKDAKEKCPDLVLVSGEDLTNYRQMSYKISNYLKNFCPLVERLGFDENFLDITQLVADRMEHDHSKQTADVAGHVFGDSSRKTDLCGCEQRLVVGSQIAAEIRAELFTELGITCCGGIAHNKLLSKLVAGSHKPNQQTTLFPADVDTLMCQLKSVRSIPGIGHSTGNQLKALGIFTVTDLQNVDSSLLEEKFGSSSVETMKKLSRGVDDSPVIMFGLPQTLSDEDSFKKCSNYADVKSRIKPLIGSLLTRLLEDGRRPHTFRLSIRRTSTPSIYGKRESRQCNIPGSVFAGFSASNTIYVQKHLEDLASNLFTKMVDVQKAFHLTLINVAFAKLEEISSSDISKFLSPKGKRTKGSETGSEPSKSSQPFEMDKCRNEFDRLYETTFIKDQADTSETYPDLKNVSHIYTINSETMASKETVSPHLKSNRRQKDGIDKWFSPCTGVKDTQSTQDSNPGHGKEVNTSAAIEDTTTSEEIMEESFTELKKDICTTKQNVSTSSFFQRKMVAKRPLVITPEKQLVNKRLKARTRDETAEIPSVETKDDLCEEEKRIGLRMPSNKQYPLPGDIDESVFKELPMDIQQEILEQRSVVGQQSGGTTISASHTSVSQESVASSESKHLTESVLTKSRKMHLNIHQKDLLHMFSVTNTVHNKGDKSSEGNSDVIDLSSNSEITKTINNNCAIKLHLPPDIDYSVFKTLPSDIQKEIISDWTQKLESRQAKVKSSLPVRNKVRTEQSGNYIKSPKPSTSNDILSYFCKKT